MLYSENELYKVVVQSTAAIVALLMKNGKFCKSGLCCKNQN